MKEDRKFNQLRIGKKATCLKCGALSFYKPRVWNDLDPSLKEWWEEFISYHTTECMPLVDEIPFLP